MKRVTFWLTALALAGIAFAVPAGPPAGNPILNSHRYQQNSELNIDTATIRSLSVSTITNTPALLQGLKINGAFYNSLGNAEPLSPQTLKAKDYGARGNGLTDDTAAIQSAINTGAAFLLFDPGTYVVTTLNPASHQHWVGAGRGRTILQFAQANKTPPVSMIVSTGNIQNWSAEGITFQGNVSTQTTDGDSQQEMGVKFRTGSVQDIVLRNCEFKDFGTKSGSDGIPVAMGALSGSGNVLKNIVIDNNVFSNNANVPGIYINASSVYSGQSSNVHIVNNRFDVNNAAVRQNVIYVLGGSTIPLQGLTVSDNRIYVSTGMDTAIELNYVGNFAIRNNQVQVSGIGNCQGILLRSAVTDGSVIGNTLSNTGSGCTATNGITALRLSTNELQRTISITGNTISGWGNRGIDIEDVSGNLVMTGNVIDGQTKGVSQAFRLVDSSAAIISNNLIKNCTYAFLIGGSASATTRTIEFSNNLIDGCGHAADALIVCSNTSQDIQNLMIRDNRVVNPVSGTSYFTAFSASSTAGNYLYSNLIPASMTLNNPSYEFWTAKVSPAVVNGTLEPVQIAFWDQGSIAMSNGQGFNIPGSTGLAMSDAAMTDFVIVSSSVDLQGCLFSAYVESPGIVRARVQNQTGGVITVAAARWRAMLFKRF